MCNVKNACYPLICKRFLGLAPVIPLGFEPRTHTLKVYCSTS